jgi:hypothetical protein
VVTNAKRDVALAEREAAIKERDVERTLESPSATGSKASTSMCSTFFARRTITLARGTNGSNGCRSALRLALEDIEASLAKT